jgi:CHASE3 domain sensor protein
MDPETKLLLIDLLSQTTDQKLEDEIFKFIFAWEEAEVSTENALIAGMKQTMEDYQEQINFLNQKSQKVALSIADDLQRQKRIQDLKLHIKSL